MMNIDLIDITELRKDAKAFINLTEYLVAYEIMDLFIIKHGKLVKHLISIMDDMIIMNEYIRLTENISQEKFEEKERVIMVCYKHVDKFLSDIGYYDVEHLEFEEFLNGLYGGYDDYN